MSDMVNGMQKYLLYTKSKRWKITWCRLFLGFRGLLHFFLIGVLVTLFADSPIYDVNVWFSLFVLCLFFVGPFLLHYIFIRCCSVGYALFYNGKVEIVTKFKTYTLNNGISVTPKVIGHHVKYSTTPVYYVVKLSYEENGKKQKVCLYTDDLDYFNAVLANVQVMKKEK